MMSVSGIAGLLVIGYFVFLFLFFIAAVLLLIKAVNDRKKDKEDEKYQKVMK